MRILIAAALLSSLAAGVPDSSGRPPASASADTAGGVATPAELADVGVTEQRNARIPLDLTFKDESGRDVPLGSYFDGRHPVILNPVYYSCPMLCGLVLDGVARAVRLMTWKPGQQFTIVTFSFNPREAPALAKQKQQHYAGETGDSTVAAGWHFLTGRDEQIKPLTAAIGFRYRWDEETQQYAHPTALVICTPDGRISRYLYGVEFLPQTLRLSLVEASAGQIGGTSDQVLLYCFHYDPHKGRYTLVASNIVRAGGLLTLAILAAILVPLWLREKRKRKAAV